ncbi:MAG: hypothetical protein AAGD06_31620 [Acidobacteriota bacterium]
MSTARFGLPEENLFLGGEIVNLTSRTIVSYVLGWRIDQGNNSLAFVGQRQNTQALFKGSTAGFLAGPEATRLESSIEPRRVTFFLAEVEFEDGEVWAFTSALD